MALYVPERFEIGELIGLEFVLPTLPQTITMNASVRHCYGFKYGVEFRGLDTPDTTLLSASSNRLSTLLLDSDASDSIAMQA